MIKYEASEDPATYLGTHVSQRRLYVFNAAATTLPTLTYDARGEQSSQSPEESEERRQAGVRILNYLLTK